MRINEIRNLRGHFDAVAANAKSDARAERVAERDANDRSLSESREFEIIRPLAATRIREIARLTAEKLVRLGVQPQVSHDKIKLETRDHHGEPAPDGKYTGRAGEARDENRAWKPGQPRAYTAVREARMRANEGYTGPSYTQVPDLWLLGVEEKQVRIAVTRKYSNTPFQRSGFAIDRNGKLYAFTDEPTTNPKGPYASMPITITDDVIDAMLVPSQAEVNPADYSWGGITRSELPNLDVMIRWQGYFDKCIQDNTPVSK